MIKRLSIYPLQQPKPADDMRNPDDRVQAAVELKHWLEWPYELEIETTDGDVDNFYGHEARGFLRRWLQEHGGQG